MYQNQAVVANGNGKKGKKKEGDEEEVRAGRRRRDGGKKGRRVEFGFSHWLIAGMQWRREQRKQGIKREGKEEVHEAP